MPIWANLRSLFGFFKSHLFQLNLFKTGTSNEDVIRNERRSTRVYLILLIISISILGIYYFVVSYTQTNVIEFPTFNEYSNLIKDKSLKCSCSNISIKYEKFIEIEPDYDELCQSKFVSNEWINNLYSLYEQSWNKSIPSDIRRIGVFQFETIHSLCQLAKDTINDGLQSFRYTDFIQSQLISQELFQDQINSFIKDFTEVTPKTFMRTLQFVQDTTAQSLIMTGASMTSVRPVTQYRLFLEGGIVPFPGVNYTFKDGFTCVCSASTATNCMGLATFENNTVPGFQTGCYMLSALMNSTLEAFYNQTFIDILSNSSEYFQKLNSSNANLKIEILLSHMFVKFWSNSTSYKKYFENCLPNSCQYTITQPYNFWAVILLLIGFFGGLSSALTIITPILIVNIWPIASKSIFRRRARNMETVTVENIPVISMSTRIKMLFEVIKKKLIKLNFFERTPPSQDETVLQQERQQTRLYLILFLIGFLILTVFTSIKPYTYIETITSPSSKEFNEYSNKYPLTLDCPCSQTTLEYNQFISFIKVEFHQICLSQFVTSRWINLKFRKSPVRVFFINDIRYQSQIHFQLLSTLCRIANQTIKENLELFYKTQLVTNQILNLLSFETQINLIFDQFKRTIKESYQRTLQLIQVNSEINQFIVPFNFAFSSGYFPDGSSFFYYKATLNNEYGFSCGPSPNKRCECIRLSPSECILPTIIHHDEKLIQIPGMFQTMFPLQSLLMSTLECFYNETCLSRITELIYSVKSSQNFSTLKLSLNYNESDPISILANNLFIQSWENVSSYDLYFNQCRPLTCQYTYQSQFSIIYIITTVIGLLGGLTTTLTLLVPPIVKLIPQIWKHISCRKRNNIPSSIKRSISNRLCLLIGYIKKRLIELNLFETIPPSEDKKIVRRSRRLTRIYLILLIISVFILIVYTYLTQETITEMESSPSISKYKQLFKQYSRTLQCPCQHISMKYDKFLKIQPEYHPICSSAFISSNWSDAMFNFDFQDYYRIINIEFQESQHFVDDDFRLWAKEQFETVSKLCSLSETIVNSSLSRWNQSDFVTSHLISQMEFNIQIDELIKEFKRKTNNMFIQTLKLIQLVNHANQLATRRTTNWKFILNSITPDSKGNPIDEIDPNIAETFFEVLTLSTIYDQSHCSCALQSNCSTFPTFLLRTSNQSLKQTLPTFRLGCFSLDALFQSTFSCLYNKTCLHLMKTAIYYSKPISTKLLIDSSFSSQNLTIEKYLSQLFVIEWSKNVSFDHYYNQCAPQSCQYSYGSIFNQLYFITTIFALFGGFTEGLHFIIYWISTIFIKLYHRRKKNQVIPHSPHINIPVVDLDDQAIEITPIPTITTVNANTIEEQINPPTNQKDRIIIISLLTLFIVTIIIVSLFWITNQDTTHISMIESTTTMIMTTTITESTTTSTNPCYITLLYQLGIYSIGFGAKSLVVVDLNNDSILDLAVTNYDNHTISVLLGNKNGTFQMQKIYSTGRNTFPWEITTADFNNDTFVDLAVALSGTSRIAIFFGIASNDSFRMIRYIFGEGTHSPLNILSTIIANDLNGDGSIDLLIGYQNDDYSFEKKKLQAVLNTGDGCQYKHTIFYRYGAPPNNFWDIDSIVIGDFDNNGKQDDISVCNLDGTVVTLSSINYLGILDNGYNPTVNFMYRKPQSLIRGRFNNDAFDDLAVICSKSDTLQVLLAYGDGTFIQQIYSVDSYPTSVAEINFNNDSINDLAILTCNGTVIIYLGTKLGIFDQSTILFHFGENKSSECVHSLRVADLNQDGKDDLVFISPATQSIKVILGTACDEHT